MADFQTSTHRANWIFTPQGLYGATLMEVDVDGTLSYPEPQVTAKDNGDKHSRPKPINIEEEQYMRVFYENKLQEVCNNFHFPHKIQSLEFDLIVYAPYRCIDGFVDDMEEFCPVKDDQIHMLKALHETARLEVDKSMLTDAPLLFPPGQLALAALRISNEVHRVLDFERYLRSILSRQSSVHSVSELIESLNAIDSWVKKYKFPSEKDLKHINRKLKYCWGLSSHDESKKREKKSKHKSKKSSIETQNVPSHTESYVLPCLIELFNLSLAPLWFCLESAIVSNGSWGNVSLYLAWTSLRSQSPPAILNAFY
uniref:Cyclin C-terminal domain-containing protein n=1 Tax=Fagus sylvatica TaxID=28930 RepID=A0A2N9G323_FAGSY